MKRMAVTLISLALLAAPLAAEGQQAGKLHRIGVLEEISAALAAANLDAFRRGLW